MASGRWTGAVYHLRHLRPRLRERVCTALMVGLAVLVVIAVDFHKTGSSLAWYHEVAAIMLVA